MLIASERGGVTVKQERGAECDANIVRKGGELHTAAVNPEVATADMPPTACVSIAA